MDYDVFPACPATTRRPSNTNRVRPSRSATRLIAWFFSGSKPSGNGTASRSAAVGSAYTSSKTLAGGVVSSGGTALGSPDGSAPACSRWLRCGYPRSLWLVLAPDGHNERNPEGRITPRVS